MNANKTVLLPVLFGLTLRNYLRTGFLDQILSYGARLICLIPDLDIDDIREEFEAKGVEFVLYPPYQPNWWEKRLRDLREVQFARTFPMLVLEYKALEMKELNWWRWFVNHKVIGPLFPKGRHSILDGWYEKSHSTETVDALWDDLKPDVLISTNSFFWEELPLIAKAKQMGTPVYGMVHSWDNLTTKNKLPFRFSKMGVWNEVMLGELKKIYPQYEEDCRIIGVPQFDYYAQMESLGKSKERFLRDLNLDPSLPLISYTTVPDKISPSCFWDVKILLEAIEAGDLGGPVNVLVRFHQTGNMEPFEELKGFPNLRVEKPGRMNAKMKDLYNPTREDMIHFADTLRHSDCTINVRSTVSVDASFFETPIVNPGADFSPGKKYDQHIRDLYRWEHYLPIVESGGVEVTETPETYITAIKRSLEEPTYRKEGRERLRQLFSGGSVGGAGKRLAEDVCSLI